MKSTALIALLSLTPMASFAQDFPVDRCVNLGNALDSPSVEGEWGYVITEADLDWIKQQGFDTVRVPVRFSAHWQDGKIDAAWLARVDQVIGQAQDRGLTVILDVHHFEDLMSDPDGQQAKFQMIWAELAGHFADYGPDLIFELLNEPNGNLTTAKAADLYRALLPMIRASNPDRWIIVGGGDWSNVRTLPDMPDLGPNIVTTFHYYDPYPFTHQSIPWDANPPPPRDWGSAEDLTELDTNFAIAQAKGGTLFLGEFGAYEGIAPEKRALWTTAVRRAAEAQGIGWCVWAMQANFQIRDPGTGDWVPGRQEALMGQ